jgi:hypothetical protein
MNAEEANPARGVAGRPRKDCEAKAEFGSAATSALRAVVMITAVVDGNAA